MSDLDTLASTERSSYAVWTYDKLRYADTDRQGHINNAVYSTFCETGRVSFLFSGEASLRAPGCEFVIARFEIDYRAELHWPGNVDIGTRVLSIGRSSFRVVQGVFKDDVCGATAESVIVQIDTATRRAAPLPPETVAWLETRRAPPPQNST